MREAAAPATPPCTPPIAAGMAAATAALPAEAIGENPGFSSPETIDRPAHLRNQKSIDDAIVCAKCVGFIGRKECLRFIVQVVINHLPVSLTNILRVRIPVGDSLPDLVACLNHFSWRHRLRERRLQSLQISIDCIQLGSIYARYCSS